MMYYRCHTLPILIWLLNSYLLLMAEQSKMATGVDIKAILIDILVGTTNKKLITGSILLIIAFLLHVRNSNGSGSNLKVKIKDGNKKKVSIL